MRHKKNASEMQKREHPGRNDSQRAAGQEGKSRLSWWIVVISCVLVAGVGTWALAEFVWWSKLPRELVGKWEVTEGPQIGALFEFSHRGTLTANLHNLKTGNREVMEATVEIKEKTLFVTTRNPQSGQFFTSNCFIRELTADSLIVEFDKGDVYKMKRLR